MKSVDRKAMKVEDYKKTKLGSIPAEWEVKTLGELGSFLKGKGILKDQLKETGLPCIRYGEIYTVHDIVIKKFHSFIDKNIAKESEPIFHNDVLFAGSGETLEDIGKAVAYIGNEEAYAGGDIVILRTDPAINSEYLSSVLNTDIVNIQKRKIGQGHSVVHIYASDLSGLIVPVPPLPEQQKIARILSTWDKAIEKTEQLIAQKQQLKKGLMQQLLTGKVRFKEFVKSSYQIKTLAECIIGKGDYGINAAGVTYSKLLPTYLRITDIDDFGGFIASSKVSVDHPDSSSFYLKEGDIVFARTGNTTGKTYLYNPKDGKLVFAGFLIRFTLNAKILLPEFLKLYTETEKYWNWVKITSSRSGQPGINSQEYCNLEIPVPKIEEQEKISRLLNSFDYEIDVLRKELLLFNLQKKGLMQQLLIGAIRTKP